MIVRIRRRIGWVLLLAALILAVPMSMLVVPGWGPSHVVAGHLAGKLDTAPTIELAPLMQALVDLDEAGSDELVCAMGHTRGEVATLAGSAMHRQLDRWATLVPEESYPRVVRLASQLAAHVKQWEEPRRCVAADLATRILTWPVPRRQGADAQLLDDCELVLRAAAGASPSSGAAQTVAQRVESDDSPSRATRLAASKRDPGGVLEIPLTGAAGSSIPVTEVELPPYPPSLAAPVDPYPLEGPRPQLLPPGEYELPREMFPAESLEQAAPNTLPAPGTGVPRQLLEPELDSQEMADVTQAAHSAPQPQSMSELSDLDLMHLLREAPPAEMAAVEAQLRNRGFGPRQLQLARQLVDPDTQVRRRLLESLADLPVSPNAWLFWFSYDPDPLIRQQVVAMMGSSDDPRLRRRLREMQGFESHDVVRLQLEQIERLGERRR